MPDVPLDSLLAKARAGDRESMERLLEAVQPQIYRFGMRMCRHPEDAEDVLQETLLTMARKLREFRGASSLSTWAYSVARSHCIKKRRKSKFAPARHQAVESVNNELVSSADQPFDELATKEAWAQVAQAIASLNPEFKEVIVLRDIEGLSAAEVSEVIGVSVSAVKSRLHRARSELRSALAAPAQVAPGCPNIVEMFSRNLEGELSSKTCAEMEEHVEACPRCKGVCNALQHDLQICKSAPEDQVPPELSARIRAALRALGA